MGTIFSFTHGGIFIKSHKHRLVDGRHRHWGMFLNPLLALPENTPASVFTYGVLLRGPAVI
eukprot:scaffold129463_cov47-Attheya_sp.AAC.1